LRLRPLDRLRFAWHDVRNFIARVYEGAAEANIPFLASGLTFDALLAAIPLILLGLSLVGYVVSAGAGRAELEIHDYLRRFLPAGTGAQDRVAPIYLLLEGVVAQRGRLGSFGIPLFIWFSTRLFGSLRSVLCEVFDIEESRSWVRGKVVDVALVVVTGFLFVLNTVASGIVAVLAARGGTMGLLEFLGAQLLAFIFVLALFVIVFRYAPARRVRGDTAIVAALICALAFEAAKPVMGRAFEVWLRPDRLVADTTLAALLVLVAWTYYMAFIFLVGASIAQVYELRRRQSAQRTLLQ
jgi:membrane protein